QQCGRIWSELAEPFRQRVAAELPTDWLLTQYPSETELSEMRQRATGAEAARRRHDDAEKAFIEWNTFKGQETNARHTVERLAKELPGDHQQLRGEHAHLEAEEKAIDAGLRAKRNELDAIQKQLEQLSKEQGQTDKQLAELKGKLCAEETTRQLC